MPDISIFSSFILSMMTGTLSGWGIGGGTLLILILTLCLGFDKTVSQFINIAYFIPCAISSLFIHGKSGFVDKKAVIFAGTSGCVSTLLAYYLAQYLPVHYLNIFFGLILIYLGLKELFSKSDHLKR